MIQIDQETASRVASETAPSAPPVVAPPPPERASVEIDDLDPYNLPFTD